ncbi:MAG TPA: NAD(P)-dependent oxidoreductase, partial [Burkholderiales bacterium]|nr:NAD(P)-dependent oxidoreductase [Burkholderiales bacterium]
MSAVRSVAFVGLGQMGRPMAANLERAGCALRSYDLNGSGTCASAAAAAEGAEVFLTMLPDGEAVRECVLGAKLRAGTLVLDMSSSDPVGTRRLGATLAAAGVALVDAPVSGGVKKAIDATLAIMAGGEAQSIERARPLLEKMGNRIFLTGPLGSGHAMKALNNYVSAAGMIATSEALAAGERFGLDPAVMTDILNASSGRNNTTELKVKPFMLSGTFDSGFSAALMVKDVATAARLAEAVGARAELAGHCTEIWRRAQHALGPGADHTAIYRFVAMQGEP